MSISDEQFLLWCKSPTAQPVWTVELDYVIEDGGEPATQTLYISNRTYRLGDNRYYAVLTRDPEFTRTLGGQGHSQYAASYGSVTIDAHGGGFDWLLDAALDGSEVRYRYGDISWPIADHRLIYSSRSVGITRADDETFEIDQQGIDLLLNKRINGSVLIGGVGPNADKPRTFNFGLVRQLEFFLVDQSALVWTHSDTGENTIALEVRVRLEPVGFTDNGDGTVTLDASPPTSGIVTGTVLALPPTVDPSDTDRIRVSDLIDVAVGLRAGLAAEGTYEGAHPTFTIGDFEDYPIGVPVVEPTNILDFLKDATVTGQFSWAITRLGTFIYLRIRPNDVASLPMTPFDIVEDDIFFKEGVGLEHEPPGYYRIRARANLNWKLTEDIAGDVIDSEEYATVTRTGLPVEQNDAVGGTYADRPELYDLTLVESPFIDTWISDEDDATAEAILRSWMEVERFNGLPWLERVIHVTVGMEFFEKELGDVANFIFNRFGYDAGELTQVIGIKLANSKIQFTLYRRRLSEPYPEGWERVTTADDAGTVSSFIFDSTAPSVVAPPPPGPPIVPPFGPPGIGGGAGLPPGVGGGWVDYFEPAPTPAEFYARVGAFEGQVLNFGRWSRSVAINSAGDVAAVGKSNTIADQGALVTGWIDVYTRSGNTWTLATTLDDSADANTALLGSSLGIADDGTIATAEYKGSRVHVFTPAGGGSYTHTLIRNSGGTLSGSTIAINRDGDIIVVIETYGATNAYVYKKTSGTWSLQYTIGSIAPDSMMTCSVSADGTVIVFSCVDTLSNLNVRVYQANFGRTTWTLTSNMTPTSDNGNTRNFEAQDIWLSSDRSALAFVAPQDQDTGSWPLSPAGNGYPTVWIYENSALSNAFARNSFARATTGTKYLGGPIALSDDGSVLLWGETEFNSGGGGTPDVGRVFYAKNPLLLSGLPDYMDADWAGTIRNPYAALTDRQGFGAGLAASSDGEHVAVASKNFDAVSGRSSIDFFRRVSIPPGGLTAFADDMSGSAGNFGARSPQTGGAYTAYDGSLTNTLVDGTGNSPSGNFNGGTYGAPSSTLAYPISGAPRVRFTLKFALTAFNVGDSGQNIDLVLRNEATDGWLYEIYVHWTGAAWKFSKFVDSSTPFIHDTDITTELSTLGVEHTITVDITASGTEWKFDGVTVATDSGLADLIPDVVTWYNTTFNSGGTATNFNISEIKVELFGS